MVRCAALVLVAQALLGRLLALAVDLDDALGTERHIRMDKDLEALGLVLQNVVRAAADDDTGALFGKLADDAALNFPEDILVRRAERAVRER